MTYVQIIEKLGAFLVYGSLILSLGAAVYAYARKRQSAFLAMVFGLALTEVGRLVRLYGPDISFIPTVHGPMLSEDSSLYVFLAKTMLMPLGTLVAALGFLMLTLKYAGRLRERS